MQFVRNMLNEQRKRAVGSLMQYLEANIYDRLSIEEQRELRARVLGAIGHYHDTCLDMMKASINDGTLINEDAVRMLAKINDGMTHLRREVANGR